ncbi:MAG: RluA family pseudouridine synthase [Clostridia bacterium]|jgi:23S rRNA pseudouridine955/2504/2580 synthase|nr:RluA family pseudouridine synthase [Spirochaetia bacterium]
MVPLLYSDDEILIIDKPAGLAVQPGEGVRICVLDAVERDYSFRPYLVHRLDKETAGCLALARSHQAASDLSSRLEQASKTYRTVVAGRPEPAAGTLTDPVRAKGVMATARTRYRTLEAGDRFSLLEVELDTGRMHQIRQHLAGAGYPILGDDKHGDFRLNKVLAKELGLKRLMLYAWMLSLTMPDGRLVVVKASLPPHFADFFSRTGLGTQIAGMQDSGNQSAGNQGTGNPDTGYQDD